MTGTEHRATFREGKVPGTWDGGCTVCGVAFYGETTRGWADAWCSGHNSAVARISARPIPLWFPPVGPGDAITLRQLEVLCARTSAEIGAGAEIVHPAAYPPLLFVWTPPAAEGWGRTRLGAIVVEGNGAFLREREIAATVAAAPVRDQCESCGCDVVDGACKWCDVP